MEALFLLVPLSLVAVGVAVWLFFRMSAGGQFDDTEGPAWSVLMDDDRASDAPPSVANAPSNSPLNPPALDEGQERAPHSPAHSRSRVTGNGGERDTMNEERSRSD